MTNARYQLPARIDIDARALCSYYVKRDERVVDPDSSASYRLFFPTIDAVFRVGIPEMSDPMETPTSCEKKGRNFSGQFEINRKAKQVEIDIVAMKIEEKLSSWRTRCIVSGISGFQLLKFLEA